MSAKKSPVDIETEWNLKAACLFPDPRRKPVDIETEWNLKYRTRQRRRVAVRRYRNRMEFKANHFNTSTCEQLVDIETEWNLKSGILVLVNRSKK